jgi:hypothetical protein
MGCKYSSVTNSLLFNKLILKIWLAIFNTELDQQKAMEAVVRVG